ncbi:MAG: hypothetical protein CMO11_00325, partial [Thaumarchaeota archaeon]|nr:hypothetical protein [Nitrososphaerota archaeon]
MGRFSFFLLKLISNIIFLLIISKLLLIYFILYLFINKMLIKFMNQKSWGIILVAILGGILLSSIFTVNSPAIPVAEAQQLPRWERNWEFINHDPSGKNFNPQTIINTDNVEHLTMKWMYPLPACNQLGGADIEDMGTCTEGAMAPPLIVDGVMFSIFNRKTIVAIDVGTGEMVWTR